MPKMPALAADETIALLKQAMDAGHAVILPRVDPALMAPLSREPPLAVRCSLRFNLTRAQGRLLAKLMEHEHVSREDLHAAMSGNPSTQVKGVDVTVCRVRRKLAAHGIEIVTLWGRGFALADRARVRELLDEGAMRDP
jgi:Transcriptional regulatory protein, C terminal